MEDSLLRFLIEQVHPSGIDTQIDHFAGLCLKSTGRIFGNHHLILNIDVKVRFCPEHFGKLYAAGNDRAAVIVSASCILSISSGRMPSTTSLPRKEWRPFVFSLGIFKDAPSYTK